MIVKNVNGLMILSLVLNIPLRYSMSFQVSSWNGLKRSTETETDMWETDISETDISEIDSLFIACKDQELRTIPGVYTYVSDGDKRGCSLYLAAPADHVIEIEFTQFDVDCNDQGGVGILDGWELDYQIFPSNEDHPQPMSLRYITFCGTSSPDSRYSSKQNVAQIQYDIQKAGQGFSVKVDFKVNYKPCNMMMLANHGVKVSLRNYGLRRNCTVMSLYPQRLQFIYVNVGQTARDLLFVQSQWGKKSGLRTACRTRLGEDSVQVLQGTGIQTDGMKFVLGFCGVRQKFASRNINLGCYSSAVRLQSSGNFYNVINFAFLPYEEVGQGVC